MLCFGKAHKRLISRPKKNCIHRQDTEQLICVLNVEFAAFVTCGK